MCVCVSVRVSVCAEYRVCGEECAGEGRATVLHVGSVEGSLRVGDRVLCTIDGVRESTPPLGLYLTSSVCEF